MSGDANKAGAEALKSLLSMAFSALGEKEYAAAAGLLTKKLMISAGQTVEVMRALRDAGAHFITSFLTVPEVAQWMEELERSRTPTAAL